MGPCQEVSHVLASQFSTAGLFRGDKLRLWKLQLSDYRAAHWQDSPLLCNFIQITHEP